MAVEKKKVIGMVAYHRHSKSRCEMKRLYVKPKYRENKLGKKLVLEILEYAKKEDIRKWCWTRLFLYNQQFIFIKR